MHRSTSGLALGCGHLEECSGLNFGTGDIFPSVSWNADLKSFLGIDTHWGVTSMPGTYWIDTWNLVGFSVPWLLLFLLRAVASQNKTDKLWQTSVASEDLWYTTAFQEGAAARRVCLHWFLNCLVGERCSCINWWNQTKLSIWHTFKWEVHTFGLNNCGWGRKAFLTAFFLLLYWANESKMCTVTFETDDCWFLNIVQWGRWLLSHCCRII